MGNLPNILRGLLLFSAGVSSVLVFLVIYGNALDTRADEELYLNKTAEKVLAGEQPMLVSEMHRLARAITFVAILTGVLLLASAGLWAYLGLFKS
jgi:hypothetical protein